MKIQIKQKRRSKSVIHQPNKV